MRFLDQKINKTNFIIASSLSLFIGINIADTDLMFMGLIGHRSILTHSVLIPYLFYYYFVKKKKKDTELAYLIIAGLLIGYAIHLTGDFYPKSWKGYALIQLPLIGMSIGGLSPLWIGGTVLVCLYYAFKIMIVKFEITKKSLIIMYLFLIIISFFYFAVDRNAEGIKMLTFWFLLPAMYFYTKKRLLKNAR